MNADTTSYWRMSKQVKCSRKMHQSSGDVETAAWSSKGPTHRTNAQHAIIHKHTSKFGQKTISPKLLFLFYLRSCAIFYLPPSIYRLKGCRRKASLSMRLLVFGVGGCAIAYWAAGWLCDCARSQPVRARAELCCSASLPPPLYID
jgi:hypothetical protein